MSKSAKNITGTSKPQSRSATDFFQYCHTYHQELFEEVTTQEVIQVNPEPVLVWPIKGYVPPPQRSSLNKNGFARSNQVSKLKDELGWQLKEGTAWWDNSEPKGARVVTITNWTDGRLYDSGNFIQACKALLDCLQPDILKNDNMTYCYDFYRQRSARKLKVDVGTLVMVFDIHDITSRVRRVEFIGEADRSSKRLGGIQ